MEELPYTQPVFAWPKVIPWFDLVWEGKNAEPTKNLSMTLGDIGEIVHNINVALDNHKSEVSPDLRETIEKECNMLLIKAIDAIKAMETEKIFRDSRDLINDIFRKRLNEDISDTFSR